MNMVKKKKKKKNDDSYSKIILKNIKLNPPIEVPKF